MIDRIIKWIAATSVDASELLVPISGGSDSAICFWLCHQAHPNVIGVHAGNSLMCNDWFQNIGTIVHVGIPGGYREREEMRWAKFLTMSLDERAWLVGSRNRTEDSLGTYSLASRVATFLPLVGTWKSDIMKMCNDIGVPQQIIASSFRSDPDCGRPKELAEIPFEIIEKFLVGDDSGISVEQIHYLSGILRYNSFKGQLPIRNEFFNS